MFFAKLLPRKKFPVLIKATFRFTSLRRKNTFSCAHMIHKLSKQASPRSSTALDTCLRIHLLVERCNQWSHSSHLTLQDGETLSRNRKESDWRTGYTKSFTTNSDAAKKLIDSGVAFAHVDVSGVFGDSPGTHSFGCSLSWHCGGHKISQNDVCQKIPSLLSTLLRQFAPSAKNSEDLFSSCRWSAELGSEVDEFPFPERNTYEIPEMIHITWQMQVCFLRPMTLALPHLQGHHGQFQGPSTIHIPTVLLWNWYNCWLKLAQLVMIEMDLNSTL